MATGLSNLSDLLYTEGQLDPELAEAALRYATRASANTMTLEEHIVSSRISGALQTASRPAMTLHPAADPVEIEPDRNSAAGMARQPVYGQGTSLEEQILRERRAAVLAHPGVDPAGHNLGSAHAPKDHILDHIIEAGMALPAPARLGAPDTQCPGSLSPSTSHQCDAVLLCTAGAHDQYQDPLNKHNLQATPMSSDNCVADKVTALTPPHRGSEHVQPSQQSLPHISCPAQCSISTDCASRPPSGNIATSVNKRHRSECMSQYFASRRAMVSLQSTRAQKAGLRVSKHSCKGCADKRERSAAASISGASSGAGWLAADDPDKDQNSTADPASSAEAVPTSRMALKSACQAARLAAAKAHLPQAGGAEGSLLQQQAGIRLLRLPRRDWARRSSWKRVPAVIAQEACAQARCSCTFIGQRVQKRTLNAPRQPLIRWNTTFNWNDSLVRILMWLQLSFTFATDFQHANLGLFAVARALPAFILTNSRGEWPLQVRML